MLSFSLLACSDDQNERSQVDNEYFDNFNNISSFWNTSEISHSERYKIIKGPTNTDNKAVQFSLFPDDFINNGKRNEFKINTKDRPGHTVEYSFKFMLPEDFFKSRKEGDWVMLHQWHDEPPEGKDWSDYKKGTHPPVNLTVKLTPSEKDYIVFNYGL